MSFAHTTFSSFSILFSRLALASSAFIIDSNGKMTFSNCFWEVVLKTLDMVVLIHFPNALKLANVSSVFSSTGLGVSSVFSSTEPCDFFFSSEG